jgi:hypothetical protein
VFFLPSLKQFIECPHGNVVSYRQKTTDRPEQPFCVKRVPAFSELPQALRPHGVQDGWSPFGSLEGMRAPDREEEWQHVAAPGRRTSEKPLAQTLAESPTHAASLLFSSPDLITARWYLVTDNAPDRAPNLTVLYRYRVEWWDEGYEHYRSQVFAANLAAVASILAPASTVGDWRPVLTSDGQI